MPSFVHESLLWWGLPLVGLPVLIHLINLMRHRRVQWAAMEFLLASQKRHRTWILFKQLLLLLLRMLAVAAVVLMVAQPLVRNQLGRAVRRHARRITSCCWTTAFRCPTAGPTPARFDAGQAGRRPAGRPGRAPGHAADVHAAALFARRRAGARHAARPARRAARRRLSRASWKKCSARSQPSRNGRRPARGAGGGRSPAAASRRTKIAWSTWSPIFAPTSGRSRPRCARRCERLDESRRADCTWSIASTPCTRTWPSRRCGPRPARARPACRC